MMRITAATAPNTTKPIKHFAAKENHHVLDPSNLKINTCLKAYTGKVMKAVETMPYHAQ